MPVSVEANGGPASVLFRDGAQSMWGTAVDNPVVAMLEDSGWDDRHRVAGQIWGIEGS
jgi:hypothetical protein